MEKSEEKLSLGTKISFGVGDIYGGGAFIVIGSYYLHFLTDVMRIRPALAGTVILVSRLWDAVSDPIMGMITDRTKTRFGRRRPYFLAGILLIFISFFLLWYPAGLESEWGKFVYVLATYLFFSTVITMVMIPYNALASELTLDYHERTSLSMARIFFSVVSSLICAVAPLEIVKMMPGQREGYMVMAAVIGAFFALPFIATFFGTREREEFIRERPRLSIRSAVVEPFSLRPFRNVLAVYLFAFVAMDILMAVFIYYMTYYIGRGGETNFVLGALLAAEIVVLPLFGTLSRRMGKRAAISAAIIIWMGCSLVSFLIGPGQAPWIIYAFAVVIGIGTGGVVVMIYAIFPDIPDIDELRSGERREGIYSGLYTFMRKLSSALAIFVISTLISIAGYRPPAEEGGVQIEQTEGFITILRVIFAVLPVVFLALSLFGAARYPLTREIHDRLKIYLERRRSAEKTTEEMRAEEEELKALL